MSTDDVTGGDRAEARTLIGAYALDAVDDVERRAVERLVESDSDAARELAELRATAAMLGSAAAAAPPADLRADVLGAIARVPQVGAPRRGAADAAFTGAAGTAATTGTRAGAGARSGPAATGPVDRREDHGVADLPARRPRRTTTWLAIAATAVGAAAIPSVLAVQQAQQAQRAEQQAQAVADLLADPQAQVVRADVTGGGTAVGVLAGDRALFTATGLDDPGTGQEYQLWVVRDGEALSAGVMQDDAGAVQAVTDEFRPGDALAVTVEPASGSQQPTSEPVVVLAAVGA